MIKNKILMQAGYSFGSNEYYTPYYGVEPILEYVSKDKTVWCPFDKEWSAFVQSFKKSGNKVIHSHIDDGQDFFTYEPSEPYDIIVSNPPFSCKDEILERLYKLDKPFMMLLPVHTLQGKKRVDLFKRYGLQLLVFDTRVGFHFCIDEDAYENCYFGSLYFCRNILPHDIIFKNLVKYKTHLC